MSIIWNIPYRVNFNKRSYSASKANGIETFDVELEEEILLILNVILASSDNPMICEISSHLGLKANKFCSRCHVGGKKDFKTSDEGYHSLFRVSNFCHWAHIY